MLVCLAVVLCAAQAQAADDVAAVRRLLVSGEYEKVIAIATAEMGAHVDDLEWPLLLGQAQGELGRYAEARATLSATLERFP